MCADITVSEMTRKHTVTEFSSLTSTEPIRTHRDLTWPQLVAAVAPSGGIPSADKTSIPLYIAGALKAAPWVGKTRERKDAARAGDAGVPSEGIQRSNGHVVCLDAAVGDVDDDPEGKRCSVWDVSRRLQKLSVAHIAYKSWSGIAGRSESGRIVAAVDRSIMSDEYVDFFRAWEELCGNQLDNQGRARSQAYFKFGVPEGTSAVDAAPCVRISTASYCRLTRWLPGEAECKAWQEPTTPLLLTSGSADYWKAKLALDVLPSDDYTLWVTIGAIFRREFAESGFALWQEWSAKSPKCDPSNLRGKWESFDPLTIRKLDSGRCTIMRLTRQRTLLN